MIFNILSGRLYIIEINLKICNNFSIFNNHVLLNIENTDNCIIKYIYKGENINSNNYNDLIKEFDDTTNITIIFQKLPKIYSNNNAFAAIDNNGNVITWGYPDYGGDSSEVQSKLRAWQLCKKNIIKIYSTINAFAAIDNNGNIITWGETYDEGYYNGNIITLG